METCWFLRKISFYFLFCFFMLCTCVQAENKGVKNAGSTDSCTSYSKLNLNNLSTFIFNNGLSDVDTKENAGLIFPKGSSKALAFISGFLWGAKIRDTVYVGGSTYTSGLQPGKIISPGVAEDPSLPKNRIYRVRPDYKTADLSIESVDEKKSETELRSQYEIDWYEWPASDGAPFTDIDGNGKYNPDKDIPGIKDAIQTIWFVANDLSREMNKTQYGIYTMGVEVQATFWTYDKDWILKNTYFRKYKLINKSKDIFKDMHIGLWSYTDIGYPVDDFSGCDTLLSLGYSYNARKTDEVYGMYPPALGFDIVQGPIVKSSASDSGIFNGRRIYGYKNLPMTSFLLYLHGCDCIWVDPADYFSSSRYRLYYGLQGKKWTGDDYYPIPPSLGGGTTKVPFSGDPVTGTGYTDGILFPQDSRSILTSSGPFEMAPGDTQEVVIAEIAAQSNSNVNSVGLLKVFSKEIQKTYDGLFNFPVVPAPFAPKLSATYSKGEINLSWDTEQQIENFNNGGYKFQGYNVYQLFSGVPDKKFARRIATFDIIDGITTIFGETADTLTGDTITVCQQFGDDSGIKRTFAVRYDSFTNSGFLIGKKYFFGLSAYTYCSAPEGKLTNTESPLCIVPVVFQDSLPGLKYKDTLRVIRISGCSEKSIVPVVIDASKITGHDYQLGFSISEYDTLSKWYLKDLSTEKIIIKDQPVVKASRPAERPPVIDGIEINVIDAPVGMKDWKVTNGSLKWSWTGANSLGYEGFNGSIGNAYYNWYIRPSSLPGRLPNTIIKFAATDTLGNLLDPNDKNASYAYRYLRNANSAPARPEFAPFVKNTSKSYDYQDYTKSLPFAAYNYETGQRFMVGYLENNITSGMVDGKYWPPSNSDLFKDNSKTTGPREWFFIFDLPYSETPDTAFMKNIYYNATPMLWVGMPARNGNAAFSSTDEFLIIKHDLFTTDDLFRFKTDYLTSVGGREIPVKFELSQNYPNPFNPLTTIAYQLPERSYVELKIYDMLGRVVTTLISKEQPAGKYRVEFNGSNLSSGVYIYRIKAGKYNASKKFILLK